MLFHTGAFVVFFAGYVVLHTALSKRWRIALIVIGGTLFYAWWNPRYVWLPHVLTIIAWSGALWIDGGEDRAIRTWRLAIVVSGIFIPLVVFKYTNFIATSVIGPFVGGLDRQLNLALPLGVSFVTFTLTAYVVEVAIRRAEVVREWPTLAAFSLFFPHLIAGPILRPRDFFPQLSTFRNIDWDRCRFGAALFLVGLAKKLWIADPLGQFVDQVYAGGQVFSSLDYVIAIYGFSAQIYCDFSGYTDMALGIAAVIGVRMPRNFRSPYGAKSIVDFWRRWHVTLSTWLRDYVYIPMGGNRQGPSRASFNILITMVLGGLWHGANWTFVLWGLVHGLAVVLAHAARRVRLPHWFGVALTFNFVTATWIVFRAPDLQTAWRVVSGLIPESSISPSDLAGHHVFALSLILLCLVLHRFDDHARIRWLAKKIGPTSIFSIVAVAALWLIATSFGQSREFIYFEF
jgi:alginate O-acetyltransferase complex protein AlgI